MQFICLKEVKSIQNLRKCLKISETTLQWHCDDDANDDDER